MSLTRLFLPPSAVEEPANTVFTLRCLPRRRCVLSTTRGSLTCIGRYISGAKSVLPTERWKRAKSAAQQERGDGCPDIRGG